MAARGMAGGEVGRPERVSQIKGNVQPVFLGGGEWGPRRGKGKEGGNVRSQQPTGKWTSLINSETVTPVALRNHADVGTSSPPVSVAGKPWLGVLVRGPQA